MPSRLRQRASGARPGALREDVRAWLHGEPRFGAKGRVEVELDDGSLTLAGEVADVAVKKLLLRRAASHPAVSGVVDRLRVAPAVAMGDGEIREHVREALLGEPTLAESRLTEAVKGTATLVREPPAGARGDVSIAVADGVVTLAGSVTSLAHKRLAGVLAWWVPGTRDVVNDLEVVPAEEDADDEISEAVRTVLDKDPFVDASRIRVSTGDRVVRLEGVVPKEAERDMAERDAWCVFGVDAVEDRIEVRAGAPSGAA